MATDKLSNDRPEPDRFAGGLPDATPEAYPLERLVEAWQQRDDVTIVGAAGGLLPLVIADLARRIERPVIVLTPQPDQARRLAKELELFAASADGPGRVGWYPEYDVGPFHGATPDRALTMRRLTTLYELSRTDAAIPPVVVSSVAAAVRKTIAPEDFAPWVQTIEFGGVWDDGRLREVFGACGYTEVTTVEDPGTFAIRGDIVDVFTPSHDHPVRVERWGDEVSDLRSFDETTQRTIAAIETCTIFPVREEILTPENIARARTAIRGRADELSVPSRNIANIISDLEAGLHFIGLDALLPAVYERLGDLADWVPEDARIVVLEPEAADEVLAALAEKRAEEYERAVEESELVFEPSAYYRATDAYDDWLKRRKRAVCRRVRLMENEAGQAATFEFRARRNTDIIAQRKHHRAVEETVRAVVEHLAEWKHDYGRICFVCRTRGQIDRLQKLLESHGEAVLVVEPPIDVSEIVPPPAGAIEIYRGDLAEGFRSQLVSLCLISGVEVFGQRVPTTAARDFNEQVSISHFRDLAVGDYIVHVDFGIGQYNGLVHLEVEGIGNDFLHLEYAGGDRLYIPVYRLAHVQKYIGATEGVRLDRLGGTSWERTKEKVKKVIREVAGDLLELYARRELRKGHAFSPPDNFYHEFEAAFPYEETPDQARAIRETIDDMCRPRPMDRLVCGDVGFGKTEVAIRAAAKAVLDGKQAAVLVPTTILCEQHILSFRNRLEEFGIRVEGLSRFRTGAETRKILEDTATGKVDVLIGTHRLLSGDIEFRDLGLLIVDEEQRFGVQHKERIKKLRANVDVLTLTATPIPRTLQMSLLGIRDLSIIATPPHDRLAVRTHVARFNDAIIREAVMREISRGGQVFFVHNRVATIGEMREHLEEILPEARIAVGHGQMREHELEEVMVDYINGETHVLLCSAIIESGLDIPNANTIIVNRADMFGLSQLYQLRGRVGRGKERAFAYLLIPARAKLKADAEKRLEVIQTYTELGSGFQVATYDLEIRGAGNLLGEDQSGHVAAVGLDLYTELLEETIDELRGEEHETDLEPEVNVPVEAYIPEEYIGATSLRLMFYKRFSLARTPEELFDTYGELGDRFGEPPQPVTNLRDVIGLKIALRALRAPRLDAGPSNISVELDPSTPVRPDLLIEHMEKSRGRLRLTRDMKVVFKLKPDESARPLETAHQLLAELRALA